MDQKYLDVDKGNIVKITKYDMHPIDFNRDTMLVWLKECGWVDNYIKMKLGRNCPYLDDYTQEIWLQIVEIADRLVTIFQIEGKGKFTNFLKMVMNNNIISISSPAYRHIRRDPETKEVFFNSEGWKTIDESFDYENSNTYKQIEYTAENPFDDYYDLDNEKLLDAKYGKKVVYNKRGDKAKKQPDEVL